ncbi:divergent PAP2 family protein [Sediminibacillus massiliensis]|uniref:divergent PAP2 family protein n=1 Tax=Sediminibacillus massiliensis TaxID=1926277 RepID=UPI000988925E|nr:divergent PAP2 family protein [Sediminibacillus massiliensis]
MLNRVLTTALIGIGTAQFLKVPLNYLETGKWDWSKMIGTGDMPSSHSAAVTSLTTYIGLRSGFKSVDFGVSSVFGMIVMYDAMGIRWKTGEIAIAVNAMNKQLEQLSSHHPEVNHQKREKELEEMLGHLPIEVAGGALLGIGLGAVSYLTDRKISEKSGT